jgi:hypothetical protein
MGGHRGRQFRSRQARSNSAPLGPSGTLLLGLAVAFPFHSGKLLWIESRRAWADQPR